MVGAHSYSRDYSDDTGCKEELIAIPRVVFDDEYDHYDELIRMFVIRIMIRMM